MGEVHQLDSFARAAKVNRYPRELCMRVSDWDPAHMPALGAIEPKHDGIRAIAAAGRVYSREGVDLNCVAHCAAGIYALENALGGGYVLDGEYVQPEGFQATLSDFHRGKGTGVFMVFDAVPVAVYNGSERSRPLSDRRQLLAAAFDAQPLIRKAGVGLVLQVPFDGTLAGAGDMVEDAFGVAIEDGWEGVVVKDLASPYVRSVNHHWMRLKAKTTVDLPIVARVLRPDGTMKAIVVQLESGGTQSVGVGFSDGQRSRPLDFPIGAVAELVHLGTTDSGALRSASFLRMRSDKQ